MALIPTLSINDSTTFSDDINFTVSDILATAAPAQSLSLVNATETATDTIIVPASTAIVYLFVRHTGFAADGTTPNTQLVDVEETGDAAFARLGAGEWLFMPFNHHAGNVGVQLHVQHASVVKMEYAYWTKSS